MSIQVESYSQIYNREFLEIYFFKKKSCCFQSYILRNYFPTLYPPRSLGLIIEFQNLFPSNPHILFDIVEIK